MFGHKTIYNVTNLKVHSKERYFIQKLKKSLFKDYNERLERRRGEHSVEHYLFQNQNPVRVFLYHCIPDGKLWMSFSFNLAYNVNLVIPNSATSLCFVDRVWKGIIETRLLSRGGGSLSEV